MPINMLKLIEDLESWRENLQKITVQGIRNNLLLTAQKNLKQPQRINSHLMSPLQSQKLLVRKFYPLKVNLQDQKS